MAKAKWKPDAVIAAIQDIKRQSISLNAQRISKNYPDFYATACEHFGSWRNAIKAAKVRSRVHQRMATRAALKGLRSRRKRALVVLATGLGKTLASAFIARRFRPKRMLFLVHNNFILDHAMGEYRLVFPKKTKVAIYNGMQKYGVRNAEIVFATWQTMGANLESWKQNHFDLVVVDEAHHTEADTYRPVVDYFRAAKLGITATPDREDEADIRDVFGPEVVNVTLEEAIARGWLPRVEYHVVTDESLDDKALQKIAAEIQAGKKRFTMAEVNRRIFIRRRDEEIAKIIDGYDEKSIVFCASIQHAERMNKSLRSGAVFHSKAGNGQEDTWNKNQQVLKDLGLGVTNKVCAVNAFNEGVNVPTVGLVAFCRVTTSLTVFRQQLGRGLRPGKDKLIALDFVGNLERIQLVLEMMNKISDLHEEYTSERNRKHEGYERGRFEVSGAGFKFTFSDRVVDLMRVLAHVERELYPTWQEASKGARRLKIKSWTEYFEKYKADERLPSSPQTRYKDFPGWGRFLNVSGLIQMRKRDEIYPTWQEAGEAARKLGLESQSQYHKGYKKDPRLPAEPANRYDDFPGYAMFLRGEGEKKRYPTWHEAGTAAKRLGIKTMDEYKQERLQDPLLPGSPYAVYKDFPGWNTFLGTNNKMEKYRSWQEAAKSARKLGIPDKKSYPQLCKQDRLLPYHPERYYSNFPGWPIFLRGEKKNLYGTLVQAARAAKRLGFKSSTEYLKGGYKRDPRLPAAPEAVYVDWPGWSKFLGTPGKESYDTCEQAMRAAKRLKFKTKKEYQKRCRSLDSLLPVAANVVYGAKFPGWDKYLGLRP